MHGLGREPRDHVTPAPPSRIRRHREGCVFGQQGSERGDIAALPRIHVALHDAADGRVAERAQSGLLALLRKPPIDGPPRTLERAVDRGDGGVQLLGHLACRKPEHVAENQHCALSRPELLQCGDEGELHGLSLFIASLGHRVARLEPDLLVGIGLDPDRLGKGGALVVAGLRGASMVNRKRPLGPPRERVQADVGRDPVQPGSEQPAPPETR